MKCTCNIEEGFEKLKKMIADAIENGRPIAIVYVEEKDGELETSILECQLNPHKVIDGLKIAENVMGYKIMQKNLHDKFRKEKIAKDPNIN